MGVSTFVLRLNNPAAMGLNPNNQVQNEVAAMTIAREGLRAFKPDLEVLVPAVYAWKAHSLTTDTPEFEKKDILEKIADIIAGIESAQLSSTVDQFGGLTIDHEAVLDFDFSSIGPPAHLFFSSLQDLGSSSDQTGERCSLYARPGRAELHDRTEKQPDDPPKRVWDRAYDELAKDQATAGLVETYLKTLSKMASLCEDDDDAFEVMKSDPLQRQAVMASAVKAGQGKIEKSRWENLTGMMDSLVDFIFKFKDVIDLAVSTSSQVSKDQLDSITYVTTRMEWYCSLTEHLLSEDNIVRTPSYRTVLDMLEERVVSLYKKLLLYQMKSLQDVKEAETAVQKDSDQYSTLHSKTLLGELVTQGQAELKVFGNLQQTLKEYMEEQRRNYMDDKLSNCLQDLYVVDPAAVMDTIQGQNDTLLFAAYEWILHESVYQKFTDWSDPCKVLWLHGPAGTGKSMLIIGIITELSRRSPRVASGLAYFFFQASAQDRTSPAHALRALIWMLLIQQPHLSFHVQDVNKNSGTSAFTNPAATWTLISIFKAMLRDKDLHPAYLVLDALDECETGKTGIQMIKSLVSESLQITNKIKWLLSSRPEIDIYYQMGKATIHGTVLQIDVKTQKGAVDAYIAHKLLELKDFPFEYQPDSLE
ncbi:hypothetical protein N7488_004876 [Penicillium malachiteum]|nr:hypothetical protein N7488_004876 [Penicillium malachiteum]